MKAELAYFFQQELQFLKKEMKRFAAEDPAARAKLQINEDGDSYADVERLVHGAAFLNARTACRIHEAQTQVYEGLLNALFPHFLAPLPAYSIAEFEPELGAFQPFIPLSKTEHKLHSSGDYPAEFRLLDNAKILPIAIDNLALVGPPYPSKSAIYHKTIKSQCSDFESSPRLRSVDRVDFGENCGALSRRAATTRLNFSSIYCDMLEALSFFNRTNKNRLPFCLPARSHL